MDDDRGVQGLREPGGKTASGPDTGVDRGGLPALSSAREPGLGHPYRWLLLIVIAASAFRILVIGQGYLELDSVIYIRAAGDYARHLQLGDFWSLPWTNRNYTAVEYWPPLYPLMAGAAQFVLGTSSETAARLVSITCGILTVLPVFALARRFWGDRAGLAAAAVVGCDPILSWYAGVARTEGLYLLLLFAGISLALGAAWRSEGRRTLPVALSAAGAGFFFALAHMTRFEALSVLACTLVALVWVGWKQGQAMRSWGLAALVLLSFSIAAAPYVRYLTALNGGTFTPVSAEKARYDALEGISTAVEGHRVGAFCARYGPPGMAAIPRDDPWVQQALSPSGDALRKLFWWSVRETPRNMLLATENWWGPVLLLALLFVALDWRDSRAQALGLLFAPVPLIAFTASWDSAPRYFAFSAPALALLAAPMVAGIWEGRVDLPRRHLRLLVTALFVALFAAWYVPDPLGSELNTGTPFESQLRLAIVDGEAVKWLVLAVAVALGCLLPPRLGAFLMACQALLMVGSRIQPDLSPAALWGEAGYVLLSLLAMSVAVGVAWATLPWRSSLAPGMGGRPLQRDEWRGLLRWVAAWALVLSLQQGLGRAALDRAYQRAHCSDEVAACLREHSDWHMVMAASQLDVIRAGKTWTPVPAEGWRNLRLAMAAGGADVVILKVRADADAASLSSLAPEAGLILDRAFPGPGSPAGPSWEWRIYRRAPGPG